tara:strand:- start:1129 stop:2388 length:1260 start_codon:yes stop_codon:yes gene_type:complete
MNKLRIGICGWGNVATGLFKTLQTNADQIKKRCNLEIEIIAIGARRDNPKCDPGNAIIERDIFKIMDHDIDVLVELIGGVDVARDLILKALNNKKNVVTANKAVIFNHGDELFSVANKNGVKLLYESSVCAGTPIIKLLNQELAASKISKISGMLNGTSNYILSNMEEGMEFEPTLKLAQEKGYAEPDPSFDIEGTDAAHKIGILSSLAFGSSLPPKDFYIEGINGIHKSDFEYAHEMGFTIKHLAVAKLTNNSIDLRAHPALVKLDSYLANLKGVRNGIEVETDLLGTLHIAGSGAGQEATASGVISDLIYLSDSKIKDVNNINESIELVKFIDLNFQYYFYIEASDVSDVMPSISSIFTNKGVSIESISQKENLNNDLVPIIIITDLLKEKDHHELVNNLLELDSVNTVRSIRIEAQ